MGQAVVRVVCEPGEEAELICLAPTGVCQYKIAFSPGTPYAVIIAAVKADQTPAPRPGSSAVHGWLPRLGWGAAAKGQPGTARRSRA
jgi:hypothetical protein